jgi:hypothetical protein
MQNSDKMAEKVVDTKQINCLLTNCLDLAIYHMSMMRTKVAYYLNQRARMSRQNETAQAKAGKQTAFIGSLNQLITAGGGNMSNLTCGGKNTTNAGKYCCC